MEIVEEIHHEVRAGDQHADVHEPGKDQKPLEVRSALPPQERQQAELGFARHGLGRLVDPGEIARGDAAGGRTDQDGSLAIVEPVQDLDGEQLSPRPHELGQGREQTDLERGGVEQQRKGGQVVLPPAHHDRLKSALADAIVPAPLADRCGVFHAIALRSQCSQKNGQGRHERPCPVSPRRLLVGTASYQRLPAPRSAPPPPPPPGRFSWGLASFTVIVRPFIWVPFSAVIAFWASSAVAISTTPNPRDWPVYRSVMILADVTDPCCENSS